MTRKLAICPFFGQLPPWMDKFLANFERSLKPFGYDLLLTTNLELFNRRCLEGLGFESSIVAGTGKLHDYRPVLGRLFEKELRGYDFWLHTDVDCAYGRVGLEKFFGEKFLAEVDVTSDCNYICGPWTLYRTNSAAAEAFLRVPNWFHELQHPATTGWAEGSFSRALEQLHAEKKLRLSYTNMHRYEVEEAKRVRSDGDRLMLDDQEIPMFHFRRTKEWPANVRF